MSNVFVYGTLMPDRTRWPLLARWVEAAPMADRVRGTVVDTRQGYPGLLLDGARWAEGFVVPLVRGAEADALAVLDAVESVDSGLYRRVYVKTEQTRSCWVYEYLRAASNLPRVRGLWRP